MSTQPIVSAPIPLDDERIRQALELALSGATLGAIKLSLGLSHLAWRDLLARSAPFRTALAEARKLGLESRADDLLTAHETMEPARATIYSRNLQWLLARRLPDAYSERVEHKVTVTLDLRDAMGKARARAEAINVEEEDWLCS